MNGDLQINSDNDLLLYKSYLSPLVKNDLLFYKSYLSPLVKECGPKIEKRTMITWTFNQQYAAPEQHQFHDSPTPQIGCTVSLLISHPLSQIFCYAKKNDFLYVISDDPVSPGKMVSEENTYSAKK